MNTQKICILSNHSELEGSNTQTHFSNRLPNYIKQGHNPIEVAVQSFFLDSNIRPIIDDDVESYNHKVVKCVLFIKQEKKVVTISNKIWTSRNIVDFKIKLDASLKGSSIVIDVEEFEENDVSKIRLVSQSPDCYFMISNRFARRYNFNVDRTAKLNKRSDFLAMPNKLEFPSFFEPSTINIELQEIEPYPTSNGYSKIVATVPFSTVKSSSVITFDIFHFFKLRQGDVDSLTVRILDQNFREARILASPLSSLVGIYIREKMDESFMVYANSNDAIESSKSNSSFTIDLPHPIIFEYGNWKAACHLVSLPGKLNYRFLTPHSYALSINDQVKKFSLNKDVYDESDLHEPIKSLLGESPDDGDDFDVDIDEEHKIWFKSSSPTKIVITPPLARILNMKIVNEIPASNTPIEIGRVTLEPIDPVGLLIEVNFTKHIIYGEQYKRIIKMIPFRPYKLRNKETFFYQNEKLDFVDVEQGPILSSINISILDLNGNPVFFKNEKNTYVSFIFRKFAG